MTKSTNDQNRWRCLGYFYLMETEEKKMSRFAVIDTETTWSDEVMSIGTVVADSDTFDLIEKKYYILTPFKGYGGMYTYALYADDIKPDLECSRAKAVDELRRFLFAHGVETIFAYNAAFDYRHMPELNHLIWHDIMKLAAYRQHNPKIPSCAECYGTGRLKRGYGVESIYRLLSEDLAYCEMHNALTDSINSSYLCHVRSTSHCYCYNDMGCVLHIIEIRSVNISLRLFSFVIRLDFSISR